MLRKDQHTFEQQLNTWIITNFVDEVYNRNNLSLIPEFVAYDCEYCLEQAVVGSIVELQMHFAYIRINQEAIFDHVEYRIQEILTNQDIVCVKIRRIGVKMPDTEIIPDVTRWEMFQLEHGRIVRRWLARA